VEKERKIKLLSLVALIVAVLGLTVAFAALSQTLTINGSASVDAAEWDVHFENLSEPTITGAARVINNPVLNGTSIDSLEVSLTKPGDSVTYTFDVVNNGTIDAENKLELLNDIDVEKYLSDESSEQFNEYLNKLLERMYPKADYDGDGQTSLEEREKAFDNIFYLVSGGDVLLAQK